MGLVSMGSCGAFVHGLEDECYSVRVAAVGMGIDLRKIIANSISDSQMLFINQNANLR